MLTLKREISTTNLLIICASSMIGSGWLFSPLISTQIAGPNALISWAIAAIFMIFIALPLCEIGSMLPISGGMANYPTLTHGRNVGFMFAWVSWLSYVVVSPLEVQAVLQYSSHFFPSLVLHNSSMLQLSDRGYIVAFIILGLITLLNTCGIKLLAECSKYAGMIKFLIPALTIFTLFQVADSYHHNVVITVTTGRSWEDIFSALSTGGIALAFIGFQTGLMLAGEAKNPKRDIPVAVLGSIVVAFFLYFLLQLSFIVAMPDQYLSNGWHNISFPGMHSPLVGLTTLLGLGFIATLLLIDSSLSPMGTAIVYTTGTSRILYSMAVNKHLPPILMKLNRFKIPYVTLIINFIVGMLAFLPFPAWQKLMAFLSATAILSYAVGPLCLPAMRQLIPAQPRPFKLPYSTLFCYIAFCICNFMLHWSGFTVLWKLNVALVLALSIHMIYKKHWNILQDYSLLWFISYMVILLLISYVGPFGGLNIIIFPYDIYLITFVSILIFYWSQHCLSQDKDIPEQIQTIKQAIG